MRSLIPAILITLPAAVLPLTAGPTVSAQTPTSSRLSLGVGASYGMPFGDLASTTGSLDPVLGSGYATSSMGMSVRGLFDLSPAVSVYAEWYRPSFGLDKSALLTALGLPQTIPVELTWTFNSFGVGGQIRLPEVGPVHPFAELGLARYRAELDQKFQGDSNVQRTDVAHGLNGGVGASIALGAVQLAADVRYHGVRLVVNGSELPWRAGWMEFGLRLMAGVGGPDGT